MGYRNSFVGFPGASPGGNQRWGAKTILHNEAISEEGVTLEAYFNRRTERPKALTHPQRQRGGGLHPLTELEAGTRPSSQGFASNVFESALEVSPTHRWAHAPAAGLGQSLSEPALRREDRGSDRHAALPVVRPPSSHGIMEMRPDSNLGRRPGSRGGTAVGRPDSRAHPIGRPDSRARGRPDSRSREESGREEERAAKVKVEAHRSTVELLSNPDLKRIARAKFAQLDRGKGMDWSDCRQVLHQLHAELGLPSPDGEVADRLFRRFDSDSSKRLDFNTFFELLLALLRQKAFDRSAIFGRDFFVNKQAGDVWARYEKLRELGSGMFGTAILVKQKYTAEECVVKAVRKSRVQIPVEDVEREILMLRQLDHPHVVRLRRWYEDKASIYLVMDYLQGGSLKDKIAEVQRKHTTLRERWVRALVQQVLQAMAYCHGLRLIHKDLKDENIMLLKSRGHEKEPFAVIIDLGMAELFSPIDPQCRHVGGTPVTMSPQVWTGTFGPKCDVWSVGCVFYQLLTGRVPFYVRSMQPSAWVSEQKRGPDWSQVRISEPGQRLCRAMLTFFEEDRPSMAECLTSPWFANEKKPQTLMEPQEMAQIQEEYVRGSALKRALLLELASTLPMEDADRIVEIFKDFDADNDGKVSLAEAEQALLKMGCTDERLAGRIFKALDLDKDGQLSFTEFSSWLLLAFEDLLEDRLKKLIADYSEEQNSTSLDAEGVKRFLRSMESMLKKGSTQRSLSLLKELKGNGGIPYEELKARLLGPSKSSCSGTTLTTVPSASEDVASSSSSWAPAPLRAEEPKSQEVKCLLPKPACVSPSRGCGRAGLNPSMQRLRMMYSKR